VNRTRGRALAAAAVAAAAAGYVAARDRRNTDQPIRAMYPLAYWGRWLATEMGPLLRQYWFESDEAERPYNRTTRNWVYASAREQSNTIGFGATYKSDVPGAVVFRPTTFSNTAAGAEDGTYRLTIGGRGTPAVTMDRWAYVSGMSFGALSEPAVRALDIGARDAGCFHNTGEGGLAPAHLQGADVIFQLGTANYGVRRDDGSLDDDLLAEVTGHDQVRMIEIKLAQGAKPAKGGMLLKEKITPEIARIRRIPVGRDALSPAVRSEFHDVDGLFDFIDRVRSVTGLPTGIKLVIGHDREIRTIARKMAAEEDRGPDFITIDGGEGGTGAAPLVLAEHAGLPMKMSVLTAHRALEEAGSRDRVAVFASGRIATPADAALALSLGADAVGIARANLLALGCIQSLKCHLNTCPTGIATQDERRTRVLDVDAAAARVTRYLDTLVEETELLAHSCGYRTANEIQLDDVVVQVEPGRWEAAGTVVTAI
jgi:glutamate synthase domain-containing protein 2